MTGSVKAYYYDLDAQDIISTSERSINAMLELFDFIGSTPENACVVTLSDKSNVPQITTLIRRHGLESTIAYNFIALRPHADCVYIALSRGQDRVRIPDIGAMIIPRSMASFFRLENAVEFENHYTAKTGLFLRFGAFMKRRNIPCHINIAANFIQCNPDDFSFSFDAFYAAHHFDLFGVDKEAAKTNRLQYTKRNAEFAARILEHRANVVSQSEKELTDFVQRGIQNERIPHDSEEENTPALSYESVGSEEKKYAFIVTFPARAKVFRKVFDSMVGQFDHIYVYLNDYESAPAYFKKHKNVTVFAAGSEGDLGARGKTYFASIEKPKGYLFFLDDDNLLSPSYVPHMIAKLEQYQRNFAMCLHGSVLCERKLWYFHKYSIYPYQRFQAHDRIVNLLGSGTTCVHSSMVDFSRADFNPYTMVDLAMSIHLAERGVGIINVARPRMLLKNIAGPNDGGLFSEYSKGITIHSLALFQNDLMNWSTICNLVKRFQIDTVDLDPLQRSALDAEEPPENWGYYGNVYGQTTGKMFEAMTEWALPSEHVDKVIGGLFSRSEYRKHKRQIRMLSQLYNGRIALEGSFSYVGGEHIRKFIAHRNLGSILGFAGLFFQRVVRKTLGRT